MKRSLDRAGDGRGVSIVELVMGLAIAAVIASLSLGSWLAIRSEARALGGARYLAARLREERLGALRRGAAGGLFFTRVGDRYVFQRVVDGNGNGLRAADVARGVDRLLDPPQALGMHVSGAEFGVLAAAPAIDGEGPPLVAGSDPVRIGGSAFVSFGPDGAGTSGTLYVATPDGRQLAVRLFGPTGRIGVFEFHPITRRWEPR